ncbi:NAD(P)-binding protein [Teratosphaeria destructans]|uniref:NAD(P)-binding protein n=1 Tax=Teratosphaeria destructans TaxID=418781 RepID=A0A9W7VZ35_9PEZI|nr:NAD(P)-binding protein [Teratosphaeria destructans]
MPNVLIVGATRGLGYELTQQYVRKGYTVFGTARSEPKNPDPKVHWITGVDVAEESAGQRIATGLNGQQQDLVIITAGYFPKESLEEPNWEAEVLTYKTSAIAPVFLTHHLHQAGLLRTATDGTTGSKLIIVSSESGSITLRHETEGGGLYAHHASKAASNMVAKLLALDLKDSGIAVVAVHPGFMRTDMTAGVGFDRFWDVGGAVTPDVAARSLVDWVERDLDMRKTGQYWAPRGAADIGTAEAVLGKKKEELPTLCSCLGEGWDVDLCVRCNYLWSV